MLSRLANQINVQSFPKGKALLAISGGVDSMVLWALCRELKIPHVLAHFNFQLRAEESDQDQDFIKSRAGEHQTELFLKSASATEYAAEHKLSIQEAARELRYQFFTNLIDQGKADFLITAHHLDDSLETFLINLNRGTGIKGLSGIENREGVFRPLLNCSKAELLEYAIAHQVEYREDSSNQKEDYLRNWFRHQLIPIWKDKNPQLLERMQDNFIRFRESEQILDHYLSREIEKRCKQKQLPVAFDLSEFDQLNYPEAVLRHWLSNYGFHADQVKQLLQSIQSKARGAVFYSRDHRLLIDRDKLILAKKEDAGLNRFELRDPGTLCLPKLSLEVKQLEKEAADFTLEQVEYFDAAKLSFPLEFRHWEAGDRMQPLGMKGQKKISDILIDEKVDRFEKEQQFVMISNSEAAWLLGNRISEAFKVEASTRKVIQIRWKKL